MFDYLMIGVGPFVFGAITMRLLGMTGILGEEFKRSRRWLP